ncbi:ABC transporter permease, partial [Acinetobacter baumannii]|nr:ABC transporter permease [Acinetobacter baumannii]
MTRKPTFLPWFIIPATLTAFGLVVAMCAVMQ